MYTERNSIFAIILASVLAMFPAMAYAQDMQENRTPFDSYVRAVYVFFVYDNSQFSPYDGPDVSHWNQLYSDDDSASSRKRWGIVSLTNTQRAYIDEVWDPMSAHLQLIDVKSNKLIHEFIYDHQIDGALLFNGQGVVYQYLRPKALCSGRQTRKFLLKKEKLVEVEQPFAYLENTATKLLTDVTLFLAPRTTSAQVASLKAETPVSVLAIEKGGWFLIKSPLGLTGWIPEYVNEKVNSAATLEITQCG